MKDTQVGVILAEGFEEIEAVTIMDVLRRAQLSVVIAGMDGSATVTGNHGIRIVADAALADLCVETRGMVALPGGMPGAENLARSGAVRKLLNDVHSQGGYVAAICAAPLALHAAGLLAGRTVTCYPGFAERLTGANCTGSAVEQDGRIITGNGPGNALPFALRLVQVLTDSDNARRVARAMLISGISPLEGR